MKRRIFKKVRPGAAMLIGVGGAAILLSGCATPDSAPKAVQAPAAVAVAQKQLQQAVPEVKALKRKIAIGRFTNETRYGKALLTGQQLDPLGKQVSDMLMARLVDSGRFVVLERSDLNIVMNEQRLSGISTNIVGSDVLVIGSLTEFGRQNEGQAGFLSNTKKQVARAKVEVRLVDVKTGVAFFTTSGTGEAFVEKGTVMGFGSQADYDATLNDRAIAAAISDMMNGLVSKLEERPWRADVLKVEGNRLYISGGQRQGVKVGDRLAVMVPGERIKSPQTGFDIELPPKKLAEVEVDANFGDNDTNEGSVVHLVSGTVPANATNLIVGENK
ncbi:CsgG/HfaB family protein [Niveispirillum sp. SYP-B3756]|uniref:CsgG/HfaB family protein n=1 Tax=Niveispirillum sp. SYP-B3756 TaxID=2662178 RepID=UPI001FFFD859|nr:CsgG/HfaB family protein [Niveispirillum sp. SYP-B3756]